MDLKYRVRKVAGGPDKLLNSTHRKYVNFNPVNDKHRAAYWRLRHQGMQDPDLRFLLEDGFTSVIAMMQAKIADHFSEPVSVDSLERRRVQK